MTDSGETTRILSRIVDQGFFERLATAILREADPLYASLAHPGVNVDGKTIKGPLDGIAFVTGANPPHMVTAHHTTGSRGDLHRKWLLDTTNTVGDIVKTAVIVSTERQRIPSLRATLALTTTAEPHEQVVREVNAAALTHRISIDLWPRSRLAHFLDNHPQGQWLRRTFLGVEQERLSRELLRELSLASIELHRPPDPPSAWIEHGLDHAIKTSAQRNVCFIAADSGLGKSVACHKRLVAHVEAGGFGLVLPHEIVAAAPSLDIAVEGALRQLYPSLAPGCGVQARQLGTSQVPLLFLVEDINLSGQAPLLTEKLARWSQVQEGQGTATSSNWRLLCPVWPRVLAVLDDQMRKRVDALTIAGSTFSNREGRDAVQRRAATRGVSISAVDADAISAALGHDPLLIALNDANNKPNAQRVINDFVDSAVSRVAVTRAEYTSTDYFNAIHAFAREMLARRQIDPSWSALAEWMGAGSESLAMVRHLVHDGRVLRLVGSGADQRLAFRHDRVRDEILTAAMVDGVRRYDPGEEILSDPYFAEIIGGALAHESIELQWVDKIAELNPLALFHTLRLLATQSGQRRAAVLTAINRWLDAPTTHTKANRHLRWHALAALSDIEAPEILTLVNRFDERHNWYALRARFRNSDASAGVSLCYSVGPSTMDSWRDQQIEHAKARFGDSLVETLDGMLRQTALDPRQRVGSLRLAGHLADNRLALPIEASWALDPDRQTNLDEYLWAAAQCCKNDPARFLAPVCDAWAALPDKSDKEKHARARDQLAVYVRWGFHILPPVDALCYFIARAASENLRWPITFMLHGIDHPEVQVFIAHELAAIDRRLEGTGGFNTFYLSVNNEWGRRQGNDRVMSRESRLALLNVWQSQLGDQHLRSAAFTIWTATEASGDLDILRQIIPSDPLWDVALRQRIRRGDQNAIPLLLENIRTRPKDHWWFLGRYIWSEDMTSALEQEFVRRSEGTPREWSRLSDHDWILSELLMERPIETAEPILLRHWHHFRFSAYYVQSALYFASPVLRRLAKEAIDTAPQPDKMLEHIDHHIGLKVTGRTGITRREQLEAIIPYVHFLDKLSISRLWEVCNERGWFDIRRQHLDALITQGSDAEYLQRANTFAALDRMASDEHRWTDLWLAGFLETGISHETVVELLAEWRSCRKTIPALEVVADALIQIGRRSDLPILSIDGIEADEAQAIVADTIYAVRRKTLH